MVNSQFGAILKELESVFNCPLEPDANDSCLIKMGVGITLQIELDRYGFLLIGCRVGTLPMNRYRDQVIREALKSNELTSLSTGIFGWSQKTSHLILFIKLNPHTLSVHQMLTLLPPFITKAKLWTDAIAKGEVPSVSSTNDSRKPSGLFGLIS